MSATLKIQPMKGMSDVREFVVDCQHGTTTLVAVRPEKAGIGDRQMVAMAIAKHEDEEHCRCAVGLWNNYRAKR